MNHSSLLRIGVNRTGHKEERDFCIKQFAMVYLYRGNATYYRTNEEPVAVSSGDFFLRQPGIIHSVFFHEEICSCWMALPAEVYAFFRTTGLIKTMQSVYTIGMDEELPERFRELAVQLQQVPDSGLTRISLQMQALAYDLLSRAIYGANPISPVIREAIAQISGDPGSREPMSDLAMRLGMSYSAFRQTFKAETGIAPGDYRIRRRMEKAMALLAEGQSLKEVADALAYSDVYAFAAQFKTQLGQTPGTFRKEQAAISL